MYLLFILCLRSTKAAYKVISCAYACSLLSLSPPSSHLSLPYFLFLTSDSDNCLNDNILEHLGQIRGYFYCTLESIALCCHLCVMYDVCICL